jgi:hypothetical protein
LLRIRGDIDHISDAVNQMAWMRKQLEVVKAMLLHPPKKKEEHKPDGDGDEDYEGVSPCPPIPSPAVARMQNAMPIC